MSGSDRARSVGWKRKANPPGRLHPLHQSPLAPQGGCGQGEREPADCRVENAGCRIVGADRKDHGGGDLKIAQDVEVPRQVLQCLGADYKSQPTGPSSV